MDGVFFFAGGVLVELLIPLNAPGFLLRLQMIGSIPRIFRHGLLRNNRVPPGAIALNSVELFQLKVGVDVLDLENLRVHREVVFERAVLALAAAFVLSWLHGDLFGVDAAI